MNPLGAAVVLVAGILLGAFVLAMIYMWLCGRHEDAEGGR